MSTRLKRNEHVPQSAHLRSAAASGDEGLGRLRAMLDAAPINVIFADEDFVIRYLNAASVRTLETIEHLLRPEGLAQAAHHDLGRQLVGHRAKNSSVRM